MTADPVPHDAFEALAHPHRRAIVTMLADREASVAQIAARLPVSRPAVSRHLRILGEAGLVSGTAQGRRRVYRLDPEGMSDVRAYLDDVWGAATRRFTLAAENLPPTA